MLDSKFLQLHPISEWHDDIGCVLWWRWPICEPPVVGMPEDVFTQAELDSDDPNFMRCWSYIPGNYMLPPCTEEEMTNRKIVAKIIKTIEADLLDRRGLRHALGEVDAEIRHEIRNTWSTKILAILESK